MVKISEPIDKLREVLAIVKKRDLYDADVSLGDVVILLDEQLTIAEENRMDWIMAYHEVSKENETLKRIVRELTKELIASEKREGKLKMEDWDE